MSKQVTVKAEYSRRLPDPNFKPQAQRSILFCRAHELPADIPLDANPRAQNTNRMIYKDVRQSLLNQDHDEPDTFHLKNKGITIVCNDIKQLDDKGVFRLTFSKGQGIVDGGHTYRIILDAKKECPKEQFVKLEILTGIKIEWIPFITGGLNTAMQVQTMSLENLKEKFDWIKKTLRGQTFASKIAYRENERGADTRPYDVRDIVSWLSLFNVDLCPLDGARFPIQAYTTKEAVLKEYLNNVLSYQKFSPILIDILRLHDEVQLQVMRTHNLEGGRAGALAFVRQRKRGLFDFIFIGKTHRYSLFDGALYPIFGAFRWMVVQDRKNKCFSWRNGGYENVMQILKKVAKEMMASTIDVSNQSGRKPNAIGKNRSHWENLFRTVAMKQLSPGT